MNDKELYPIHMPQWTFLTLTEAQSKLGQKVPLALFFDAHAPKPEIIAVPFADSIQAALEREVGVRHG